MRADQTVGGGPTDKEAAGKQPEAPGASSELEPAQTYGNRIARRRRWRGGGGRSIGVKSHVSRMIFHQQHEDGDQEERPHGDRDRGSTPAGDGNNEGQQRQESNLPCR